MTTTRNTWTHWRRRTKKKETKHGEWTKINRNCVWTRDIANSTTSQLMRSCVCTASAHCWSTEAAAGAATTWRHRTVTRARVEQVSIRGRRVDAILRLNLPHLIQQMNARPVFHFHLVQRSWMELHEHAPCIPIWEPVLPPSVASQFFPKESARKFLINLHLGYSERRTFQASGVA